MYITYVQRYLRQNRIMIAFLWIYGEIFLFFCVGGVFSELALFRGTLAGTGGICLPGAVSFLLLLTDLVKQKIKRLCQINTVQVGPMWASWYTWLITMLYIITFSNTNLLQFQYTSVLFYTLA